MAEIEGNASDAGEAHDAVSEFRETQELIAQINRAMDEEQERELEALDDAIAGTDRHELRRLRQQLGRAGT
jgi:hypothetical protein